MEASLGGRSVHQSAEVLFPGEFELAAYRQHNPGLAHMDDAALEFHYQAHGRVEGRRCSRVHDRTSFVAHVPSGLQVLEIGPFWAPAFRAPRHDVAYLDVFDREELQRRAAKDPNSRGAVVPEIDYVWHGERYCDLIKREFDVVFSSHNIEHQPDLVAHLQDVASVLRPGGMFCLVIPDKRYCFDRFIPETMIPAVIEAHIYRRRRHSLATLLTDKMMHTHNEAAEHWRGNHGRDPRSDSPSAYRTQLIEDCIAQAMGSNEYIDAHAWQFTPDGFRSAAKEVYALGFTTLRAARVYQTVYSSFEFYAVLEKVRQMYDSTLAIISDRLPC